MGILVLILFIVYIYLGDKANQYCKRHILHLETVIVYDVFTWLTNRAIWGCLLGWLTIPIMAVMWIFGVRE